MRLRLQPLHSIIVALGMIATPWPLGVARLERDERLH
jgi:hypothetical protein